MKSANSNPDRFQRGHESQEHRSSKPAVIGALRPLGFDIALCEHRFCDVVAVRLEPQPPLLLAIEIQNSAAHLWDNLDRDLAKGGADGVLVVGPDFETMAALARKLARTLTVQQCARVGLANLAALKLLQPGFLSNQTTNGGNDAHT